jgi:hypothetical protein
MKYFLLCLLILSSSLIFCQQNDSTPKHKVPPKILQHGMGAILLERGEYERIPHLKMEFFPERIKKTALAANTIFHFNDHRI